MKFDIYINKSLTHISGPPQAAARGYEPAPPHPGMKPLAHQIKQLPSGQWALVTKTGYVLFTAATRAEVVKYYRWHCTCKAPPSTTPGGIAERAWLSVMRSRGQGAHIAKPSFKNPKANDR
jgi:hypothetical protein